MFYRSFRRSRPSGPDERRNDTNGYIAQRRGRFYAVIYEGLDPVTGKELRSWHPAGTERADAERLAARNDWAQVTDLGPVVFDGGRGRIRTCDLRL